jgi:HTH-type transcriptional regulator/antitoxin HigA
MIERRPAEVFPPGEFIREELEARGWTQTDLAEILGRPFQLVNDIIAGKRAVTPETAKGLGDAFGTGAELWLNMESAYQLHRVKNADPDVAKRARLYALAPLKDMTKRGWIEFSAAGEVLEKQVCKFFKISNLEEEPEFLPHAARKSTSYDEVTPSQRAWLFRAWHLAHAVDVAPFSDAAFEEGLERLRAILPNTEEVRQVPRILAEMGVRFLVIEPLPQTRIDGVCFWLDEQSPVIALSLRYDRIDSFWFTLMHELGHLKNRDGLQGNGQIDTDLVGEEAIRTEEKPEYERRADEFAASFLIPGKELESFIVRTKPLYAAPRIIGFAKRLKVHPGIVVGQLHRRGEFSYSNHRKMLDKIRHILSAAALTDGWGSVAPTLI